MASAAAAAAYNNVQLKNNHNIILYRTLCSLHFLRSDWIIASRPKCCSFSSSHRHALFVSFRMVPLDHSFFGASIGWLRPYYVDLNRWQCTKLIENNAVNQNRNAPVVVHSDCRSMNLFVSFCYFEHMMLRSPVPWPCTISSCINTSIHSCFPHRWTQDDLTNCWLCLCGSYAVITAIWKPKSPRIYSKRTRFLFNMNQWCSRAHATFSTWTFY